MEVGAALAAALPPIAKRWSDKGEVSLLRELISHELLDRMNRQGHWKEYAALIRLLITAMDQLGDVAGSVFLRCRLARKVAQAGDLEGGWSLLREGDKELGENGPVALHAELHSHRSFLAYLEGDQFSALKELRLCIELRTALADHAGLFVAHKLEGNILLRHGEHRAAAASFNAALTLDIFEGSTQRLEAETSLAVREMRLSREEQARERLDRVIRQMRASGVDAELARALFTRALLSELQGMPAQALDLIRQAADLPTRDPAVRMAINRMVWRLERFPQGAAQGLRTQQRED
jgi:tetratricopeptide (TPR) repeat protein